MVNKDFNKALEECDFEVQARCSYIDEQLDTTSDAILELTALKEQWLVERDIADRLGEKEDELQAKFKIKEVESRINYMEDRYEVLQDLWDELYFGVMGLDRKTKNRKSLKLI